MRLLVEYNCEVCGTSCGDQFGDVNGAIVCGKCLGQYGGEPNPEVQVVINDSEGDCNEVQ